MDGYISEIRKKIGKDMLMIVGAGVFIHKDGKILLQRRKDDGTWADHGGALEIGETLEETARREVLEETGLTAGALQLIGIASGPDRIHVYPNGDQTFLIGAYYLCEDFSGTLKPQPEEVSELRWFDINDLPDNIMHLSREPLAHCVEYILSR